MRTDEQHQRSGRRLVGVVHGLVTEANLGVAVACV